MLRRGRLGATLDDLERMGLASGIVAALRERVAKGDREGDVVAALLEALIPWATAAGGSRQLLRALRRQFRRPEDCAELRRAVAAIVGAPAQAASG